MAAAPRGPRPPVARSSSTSQVPAARSRAARAAAESGARPRLVCSSTPVAFSTGRRPVAVVGNESSTALTTASCSTGSSPRRARSCAAVTADLTRARPSRSAAAAIRGSARTASVRGTPRRGSTVVTGPPHDQPPPPRFAAGVRGGGAGSCAAADRAAGSADGRALALYRPGCGGVGAVAAERRVLRARGQLRTEQLVEPAHLVAHALVQPLDATQLLLGGLATALEVLLAAVAHLLGTGLRLADEGVGGVPSVVGDAGGVVAGRGKGGGGLLLALLQGHVALG